MSENNTPKSKLKSYILYLIVGLIITAAAAFARGFSFSLSWQEMAAPLSDGTFVAAVILIGFGLLTLVSSAGFFDIMRYGAHRLKQLIPFAAAADETRGSYYDYKQKREEKRGRPLWGMILVGAFYFLLSLLFLTNYSG